MLERYWTIPPRGTSCRYDRVESMQIPVLEMSRGLPRTPISRGNVTCAMSHWTNLEKLN